MVGIGSKLRESRLKWQLTLREVEERSSRLALQWENPSYSISASWLDRVEREDRELSATKLIVLAAIYSLTADQMIALCPASGKLPQLDELMAPNATLLLTQGPLEQQAKDWLPDSFLSDPPPETTTLLPSAKEPLPAHYCRGVIGRRDRVLEPMVAQDRSCSSIPGSARSPAARSGPTSSTARSTSSSRAQVMCRDSANSIKSRSG